MGLASSQARLISLTSRQHSVEYRAQQLQNNKLQLSNDSDYVYSKYMDALDSVKLTTKQTNSDGKISWIAGNINNLLRKDANENTVGEVFYVQNIENGKLYIPNDIGTIFDANSDNMTDFVTAASGGEVTYTTINLNQYILDEYNEAVNVYHWNDLMTESQYEEYLDALSQDVGAELLFDKAYKVLPSKNNNDRFEVSEEDFNNFRLKLNSVLNSEYYDASFNNSEKNIIEAIINSMTGEDKVTSLNNKLNGTRIFLGNEISTYSNIDLNNLTSYSTYAGENFNTYGDALRNIFKKRKGTYAENFLKTHSPILTETDVKHYKKYLERKRAYQYYEPKYETTSSDAQKAKYWEEIYKAIKSQGWISVNSNQAKNDSWTSNIVKSNVAILTTWDEESDILSKTATELSLNIREMTDENYIERVSQKYEAEMAEINAKDVNIDNALNQLETERTAITTEIEGIKKVLSDNVEANFKTFG